MPHYLIKCVLSVRNEVFLTPFLFKKKWSELGLCWFLNDIFENNKKNIYFSRNMLL